MIEDPAGEASRLRSDSELVSRGGDAAKAKLLLETAAVLDAQAAATVCKSSTSATVNTANNAALMARLMATSSNTTVLATCRGISASVEGAAADDTAAQEESTTLPLLQGESRMSLQLSRRSSLGGSMLEDELSVRAAIASSKGCGVSWLHP
jgi:hypothetical protein